MTILGSKTKDTLGLIAPGYLLLILVFTLDSETSLILFFLAFIGIVCIDSGHVYTSFLRGAFFKSNALIKTVGLLTFTFLSIFAATFLENIYFWSAITYLTFFHHVRQFYGFIKWSQKSETHKIKYLDLYFYSSILMSFLTFHTHPEAGDLYFMFPGDILNFGSLKSHSLFIKLNLSLLTLFLAHQYYTHLKIKFSYVLMFTTLLLYFFISILSPKNPFLLIPLLYAHGIPYFLVVFKSRQKILSQSKYIYSLSLVFGLGITLGLTEYFIQENFVTLDLRFNSLFENALLALLLTPLIFHYLIDSIIWKGNHFLAHKIYNS